MKKLLQFLPGISTNSLKNHRKKKATLLMLSFFLAQFSPNAKLFCKITQEYIPEPRMYTIVLILHQQRQPHSTRWQRQRLTTGVPLTRQNADNHLRNADGNLPPAYQAQPRAILARNSESLTHNRSRNSEPLTHNRLRIRR